MLTVSSECEKCGICGETCPMGIIHIAEDGPEISFLDKCIECGHCIAVCPKDALDYEKAPLDKQVPLGDDPVLDPLTASRFLRSRRSIRCYKQEPVSQEKLLALLEIARFAPTGGNSQGLSYVVVTERQLMEKLTEATVEWVEELVRDKVAMIMPYAEIVDEYRQTKRDVILRGAPHLIVATAPKEMSSGQSNARFSLAYVELFAPTLGLGTCWAGFLEQCGFSGYPKLLQLLGIEENMAVAGAVMVGYPRYTYRRMVDRNPLQVTWR
ncbi:MAG TPA: nitroreductase family protein [Methylomusa anaerophila]|uniref:Ferredoxin n=1 Tax=Methylomusa anaerophila TaxID=1930071 RepID=A0A348AJB1_9FIRM|nr:nitroreductase family protein [Methylomusa anaerophila]BBB91159.1 ferredoxin [Methylomusa anaerophila]HML89037.1 nitroreductase family protein [Methylomusa anaerophila]